MVVLAGCVPPLRASRCGLMHGHVLLYNITLCAVLDPCDVCCVLCAVCCVLQAHQLKCGDRAGMAPSWQLLKDEVLAGCVPPSEASR